jgi:hypothetical protein
MDSRESERKKFYPGYKAHRQDRNLEKRELVLDLQEVIREDPSFRKIEVSGFEADDLIASLLTMGYWYPIIGRDKDLLQIPGISLITNSDQPVTFSDYSRKLPKRIAPLICNHKDVLFSLVLLGDKSDDIPRLLPPRKIDLGAKLISMSNPWIISRKIFGDDLLRNLWLTILPGPFCYEEPLDPEEVFDLVSTGNWPPKRVLRYELSQQLEELSNVLSRRS